MTVSSGLEDVVAADTVLSHVDGMAGQLIIRGISLDKLVEDASYERVVSLLLDGFVSDLPTPAELPGALGAARCEVFSQLQYADETLIGLPLVDGVRALTARFDDNLSLQCALALIAAPAVFAAGLLRLKAGNSPLVPDANLPHATDILRMCNDAMPNPAQVAALNCYLVTVADHGLNASTFTARVVASTGAGLTSASLAAIGALKGPLHGGAPGPILDMLDDIGTPDNAGPWFEAALDRGERLMGFGHRVYRVRDPRIDALKGVLGLLADVGVNNPARLALAEASETAALELLQRRKPDRALKTNVEFYTALLLEALGFPREAFTPVFAMGRSAGWIAHAQEQAMLGRLIRPQANYVGPMPQQAA